MPEIKPTNYRDIKFTRDTKVDYAKGNAIINSVFKQYDKDLSGDFNDEEWAEYENSLKVAEKRKEEIKNINDGVVKHYDSKLQNIIKKYEKLEAEFDKIDFSAWNELLAFEEAHPQVCRFGYKKGEEIPKGAVKVDISGFQMGILDEEKDCYTGECYEEGYITGLETLSDNDKQQYMQLLQKASLAGKELQKLEKQNKELDKAYDKYHGLKDMAENGMISKVGSKDYENQAYEQYVQIRNSANPFYNEIKNIENKIQTLRLKRNQTNEDKQLIERYNIQLQQLNQASKQWSVSDGNQTDKVRGTGFMLTEVSEQITSSDSNENSLINEHTAGAMYSNENLNIMANFSNKQTYTLKPTTGFENSFNAMLMGDYKRDDLSVSSQSVLSTDKNLILYNQTVGFGYRQLNLEVSENIMKLKEKNVNELGEVVKSSRTTYTTEAKVSHNIGHFTNSLSASFTESGDTYTIASNANFNKQFSENNSLSISPTFSTSYNEENNSWEVRPMVNANWNYNKKDFRTNISVDESYSATMQNGKRPSLNHNLTTRGDVTFKRVTTTLKFNDSDSEFNHSNTYGVGVSYRTPKAGTFGIEYSYQTTKDKINKGISNTNLLSFKYSMPLDWTRKKKN